MTDQQDFPWSVETMRLINELTPDIKGKAFNPDWFFLRQRLEQFEAAAQLPAGVPDGWVLVPVEPTGDMVVAFAESWYSRQRAIDDPELSDAYRAMLAAAPQPDSQKSGEGESPLELRVCEVAHLALKPNTHYLFTIDPNCESCREAAAYAIGEGSQKTNSAAPGGDVETIIQRVIDELREEEHERRQEDRDAGISPDTETAGQLATWANHLVLAMWRLSEGAALSAPKQTEPTSIHPSHFWIEDGDEYI